MKASIVSLDNILGYVTAIKKMPQAVLEHGSIKDRLEAADETIQDVYDEAGYIKKHGKDSVTEVPE